jgi:hypothetical protein
MHFKNFAMVHTNEGLRLAPSYHHLLKRKDIAKNALSAAPYGNLALKKKLIEMMEKRWDGTFALIGQSLSTKL